MKKKNILFVSHDASRTGAPIVLLDFLRWLKNQGVCNFTVLIKDGAKNAMQKDFQAVAPSFTVITQSRFLIVKLLKILISRYIVKSLKKSYKIPKALQKQAFDLIYLNTTACLDMAPILAARYNCPVMCHIHESEYATRNFFPDAFAKNNIDYINAFLTVSQSAKRNLIENYNVDGNLIQVLSPFINLGKLTKPGKSKDSIKQELNINNEFIVGGCGNTTWIKGIDYFMQLAVYLNKSNPNHNIKLLWVGHVDEEFRGRYNYEAKRLNIENNIIFTGATTSPQDYFQVFDVFTLTSREDSFPLVMIEAAGMKKPIVFFEQSGGVSELIVDGISGVSIPYGNADMMADKIAYLAQHPEIVTEMGEQAGRLCERFNVDAIGEQMLEIINYV